MTLARHAARSTAVLATAAGMTVAAAAAAHATTATAPVVNGTTVSVTFTLQGGQVADACGAVLTPTAAAAGVADRLMSGDLSELLGILSGESDTIVLRSNGLPLAAPTLLGPATVSASAVPSNVYALVTVCASDRAPKVTPTVLVGNPLEAIGGSAQTLSAEGNFTAGSSLVGDLLSGNTGGGLGTASHEG